jgi:hypothetical protein
MSAAEYTPVDVPITDGHGARAASVRGAGRPWGLRLIRATKCIGRLGVAAALLVGRAHAAKIDEEHIFGFTEGTEIGSAGDVDTHIESFGRIGARAGRYATNTTDGVVLFTLTEDFRIAPTFSIDTFSIHAVPGLDNRSKSAIEGPSLELKYRVLDYQTQPFGLTLGATPFYARVDALTGEPVRAQGSSFLISLDRVLLQDGLYGAINAVYALNRTRGGASFVRQDSSFYAASGAITAQVVDGILFGGELRHARAYAGLGLDRYRGSALYAGPNFYVRVSEKAFVSGGLNIRAASWEGHPAARVFASSRPQITGGTADFQRYQFVLRYGQSF